MANKMMFSEKAQIVLKFFQNGVAEATADQIAAATGLEVSSVNGTVTGLAKKGYATRSEEKNEDGKRVISLTAAGMSVDPAAEAE